MSAAILVSLGAAGSATAQEGTARFVIVAFENTGSYGQGTEVFQALGLGVAAMLARAIDRHPGADVIERHQRGAAGGDPGPGAPKRVDAAGAAQIGRAAGAHYTVTGSFADFYGKFRIIARLVDAKKGAIVKVISNDDPKLQDRAQLASIIQAVGERITSAAGLSPYPDGSAPPPIPTDAITAYSRGLLHDSRGESARASEFYQSALSAFPPFDEARAALGQVRGR